MAPTGRRQPVRLFTSMAKEFNYGAGFEPVAGLRRSLRHAASPCKGSVESFFRLFLLLKQDIHQRETKSSFSFNNRTELSVGLPYGNLVK